MTDQAENPRFQPLRANIMAELPKWLERPGAKDSVMLYFSGHGFRDAKDQLYLTPLDFDRERPAETGVPVEWLRQQLAECKAHFKLLLLDSCHAGSEKGADDKQQVAAAALGEPFRDVRDVVTIASSTANEKSQLWEERQQSLFSYWLNQGLKGHADRNGDGVVDIDELYDYVHGNVTRTATARFPLPQTPVRIIRGGQSGVPEVIRPRPQSLRGLLADIAERLADAMQREHLPRVGVLPFIGQSPEGQFVGANFGALGHWCAADLENRLVNLGEGRFSVLDCHRLQDAANTQKFEIAQLGSADALRQLSERVGGLPALVEGTLSDRKGRVLVIKCNLVRTDTSNDIGSAAGSAALSTSEWAMLGHSVVVSSEDHRPETVPPGHRSRPLADQLIERLDEHATRDPHPFKDPEYPLRVRLMVDGVERKGALRDNDYFVPLRIGEEYAIEIENNTGRQVLMRLLVDGLNTLPQAMDAKGLGTMEVAPRVNLDSARHWSLDPKVAKVFRVSGFVTVTGAQGKWRKFRVAQAEKSLAARKQFTDQLGLITAAFYLPGGGRSRSAVATEEGEEVDVSLPETKAEVGNLLTTITIRYVDAEDFKSLGK